MKKKQTLNPHVPLELLSEIFLLLPPEDLIRCLVVCKAWSSTIRDHRFIKAHLERSTNTNSHRTLVIWQTEIYDPPTDYSSVDFHEDDTFGGVAMPITQPLEDDEKPTDILGYCNGLLCIHNNDDEEFAFWNPSIQRFKRIPSTIIDQPSETKQPMIYFGFGYDSANDDYKLVRMMHFTNWDEAIVGSEVKVYSLKSNSWKRIQNLPDNGFGLYSNGLFLNGALHWLMVMAERFIVLTLDLASENYNEFPTPFDGVGISLLGLHALRGCLCICVVTINRNVVWIMTEYGATESWSILYSIENGALPCSLEYCTPLVVSKNGEMVLLNPTRERLFWYDLEEEEGRRVEIPGTSEDFSTAICVGNLCLLDGDPVEEGATNSP